MTGRAGPLRLAVDATPLLGPRTGIGVFTDELVQGLAATAGVTTVAYAATWRGRGGLAPELPPGVVAVRRPMAARPLRAAWRRGRAPIEWWTGPVDLVHGTNYVVPATRRAARLVTVHDLTVLHYPQLCTDDTLEYPRLLRAALDEGAHVHTDSRFVADEVRTAFGLPAERVHPVPLGVSALPPTAPGEGRTLAGSDRYVLALGTVEPRKDLPRLVEAFDQLAGTDPQLHLVVAGTDGWGRDDFLAAVARAHHRARITRIARFVTAHERAALLRDATVFAYPSRYEGFGLPPLEAMAAGTPVVATRTGSLPEVLGEAALLCAVDDVDGLAGALHRVLTDASIRARLVEAGRARAGDFSWRATCDGMLDVYADVLDAGGHAVPSSG